MTMTHSPIQHDDHVHLRPHIKPPPPHRLDALGKTARDRGVTLGVREHAPLPVAYRLGEFADYEYAMRPEEVDPFLSLFENSGVAIGLEVDYIRGYQDEVWSIADDILNRAAARGIAISGVNGSVHFLPGEIDDLGMDKGEVGDIVWDLDEKIFIAHVRSHGAARMVEDYFERVRELIATHRHDTLSHLEIIRKFDRVGPDGKSAYFGNCEKLYMDHAVHAIELAEDAGMAIELNTAGVHNPLGRPYLSRELVEICRLRGAPLCVSSDTHAPDGVAAHFELALDMFRRAGVTSLVTFQNRTMIPYRI